MTPDELLSKLALGMSRDDVVSCLGEPDHIGGTSRKYKTPSIYKYGDIELWFERLHDGALYAIWDEKNEVMLKQRNQE